MYVSVTDMSSGTNTAQQDCPSSGLLWSMGIWMEAAPQRKSRSIDAIKKSQEHPIVINAVGRLFWNERKIEKARLWLGRAVGADKDNGDLWAWWYKFEKQHGEKVSWSDPVGRDVVLCFSYGEFTYAKAGKVQLT